MPGIKGKTLALAIAAVLAVEVALNTGFEGTRHPLLAIGLARILEMILLGTIVVFFNGGLSSIGLSRSRLPAGIRRGAVWSAGFGGVIGIVFAGIFLAGVNPLEYIRADLPTNTGEIFLLFAVGGVIAPLAEELFFRGILFGYCRRWGFAPAILISTALFSLAHYGTTRVFLPQIISGLLLAGAYEREKNLVVPITIHTAANLAIFTLSLV